MIALGCFSEGAIPPSYGSRSATHLSVDGARATQWHTLLDACDRGVRRKESLARDTLWRGVPGRNARAAGQVTLSRGRHTETVAIAELGPEEAAPVLKQYVTEVPITRPFFDAKPDSPLGAFVAEAHRHPVFSIHGAST